MNKIVDYVFQLLQAPSHLEGIINGLLLLLSLKLF